MFQGENHGQDGLSESFLIGIYVANYIHIKDWGNFSEHFDLNYQRWLDFLKHSLHPWFVKVCVGIYWSYIHVYIIYEIYVLSIVWLPALGQNGDHGEGVWKLSTLDIYGHLHKARIIGTNLRELFCNVNLVVETIHCGAFWESSGNPFLLCPAAIWSLPGVDAMAVPEAGSVETVSQLEALLAVARSCTLEKSRILWHITCIM